MSLFARPDPAILKIRSGDFSVQPHEWQLHGFKTGDVPTPFQLGAEVGVISACQHKRGNWLVALHTETACDNRGAEGLPKFLDTGNTHHAITAHMLHGLFDKSKDPAIIVMSVPKSQDLSTAQKIAAQVTAEANLKGIQLVFAVDGRLHKFTNGKPA